MHVCIMSWPLTVLLTETELYTYDYGHMAE